MAAARCPQHPDAPTYTLVSQGNTVTYITWHCSVCGRTVGQAMKPKRGAA